MWISLFRALDSPFVPEIVERITLGVAGLNDVGFPGQVPDDHYQTIVRVQDTLYYFPPADKEHVGGVAFTIDTYDDSLRG